MGSLQIENVCKGYGDLRLFNEMRDRERQKFIYTSMDGLLYSPSASPSAALSSKYGDGAIGLSPSTPSHHDRGLPLDANKNDYDWLLTPPTTPLFPCLDEDVPPTNLSQRRLLTRTTSTMSRSGRLLYPQEPLHKTVVDGSIRGLSPSVSTGSSTSSIVNSSRGRASSPSCSSSSRRSSPSSRTARSSNPSPLRPSSPYKHSVSPGRSRSRSISRSPISRPVTPTPQCSYSNNTSPSSGSVSTTAATRGMKGKCLSPQFRRWDSSLVDFSSDPLPNLRTSMTDRAVRRGGPQQPSGNEVMDQITTKECYGAAIALSLSSSNGDTISPFPHDERIVQSNKESVLCRIEKTKASSSRRARPDLNELPLKQKSSPGKREIKPSGIHRSATPAMNKQSGHQLAQRRSSQPMFRPLLSSAPVTSCRGLKLRSPSRSLEDFSSIFTGGSHVLPNHNGAGNSDSGKEVPSPEEHSRRPQQAAELASSSDVTSESGRKIPGNEFDDGNKSSSGRCINGTAMDRVGCEDVDDDIDPHDLHINCSAKHREESMPCQSEFPTLNPFFHHLKDHKHPSSRGHDVMSSKNDDSDVRESSPADAEQHQDNKASIEDPGLDLMKTVPIQEAHSDGLTPKLLHHDVELVSVQSMADMKMDHISKDDVPVREAMGAKHEGGGDLCKIATLKRSVTLEEATDTILFCNSIIQELVHSAAAMADKHGEARNMATNSLSSKKEFVTLFGFSGPEEKAGRVLSSIAHTRKRQIPTTIAVQETKVQKQRMRMIHRQSEALTMKQSPTERIGNAVMGNLERMQAPPAQKSKNMQAKTVQSKCSCCMM